MYFVCKREEDDCKELFGGALGYFGDKESAMDAVHRNATDMRETIYPYTIIERLNQGIFPVPKEREWFGWEEEKDGFYKIATPECAKYFPDGFSVALGAIGDENSEYTKAIPKVSDTNLPNYFIVVMTGDCKKLRRCGFFTDREIAFRAVRENWRDIHSDTNDIALIECITPDILAWSTERTWFKWNDEKCGYFEATVPEAFFDYPPPPHYSITFF